MTVEIKKKEPESLTEESEARIPRTKAKVSDKLLIEANMSNIL